MLGRVDVLFRSLISGLLLTVLTCSQGLLIAATKRSGTTYSYSTVSANLTVECVKLIFSFVTLQWVRRKNGDSSATRLRISPRRLVLYPIPAALYLIKNLLQYVIFIFVEAPSYQILKNLNVLTTAVLYSVLLNKHISKLEWCSLLLLSIGCVVSQLRDNSSAVFQLSSVGLILSLVMALLSSFAGVYTEKIMKGDASIDINVQNFYLYVFGVLFNSLAYFVTSNSPSQSRIKFFSGYTPLVWLMISNHAFSGIVVSYVLRFGNNLTKVRATSLAVALTTLMSVILLDYKLQIQFLLGFLIVAISLYIPTLENKGG